MKITYILLFAVLFVATACSYKGIGKDFDTYVVENGNPITSLRLRNGNTIYTYEEPCKNYPGIKQEYSLKVNSKNKIVRRKNINSCRGDYKKKQAELKEEIPPKKFTREMFPQYED